MVGIMGANGFVERRDDALHRVHGGDAGDVCADGAARNRTMFGRRSSLQSLPARFAAIRPTQAMKTPDSAARKAHDSLSTMGCNCDGLPNPIE